LHPIAQAVQNTRIQNWRIILASPLGWIGVPGSFPVKYATVDGQSGSDHARAVPRAGYYFIGLCHAINTARTAHAAPMRVTTAANRPWNLSDPSVRFNHRRGGDDSLVALLGVCD
jgi:hypothetical protein